MQLVYIAGSGRSGSTLLARALGGFESVVNLGELSHFWNRGVLQNQLCGCGVPFRSCPFWEPLVDECDGTARAPRVVPLQRDRDRVRYTLPQLIPGLSMVARPYFARDRHVRAYVNHLSALYGAISRRMGPDSILVDGSKSAPYLMSLRAVEGLQITVLHIVRDSRSVAMSWKRRRIRPEITDTATEMPTMSARAAAVNWDFANTMADGLRRLPDLRYLRVRHEELVAQPIEELTRLVAPLGISPRDAEARFVGPHTIAATVDHTVSGNPNRFDQGDITLRPDSDWKAELSAKEVRIVTGITAPLLRRYGYPL